MKLGINAYNILSTGGVVHLKELLSAAMPLQFGFSEVVVWARQDIIDQLPERDWLKKVSVSALNQGKLFKLIWMFFTFSKEAKDCDLLLIPGGVYLGLFKPFVTILQNMLPFESGEAERYLKASFKTYLKLKALKFFQRLTLRRATGAIFLSLYAKKMIAEVSKKRNKLSAIIFHGMSESFRHFKNKSIVSHQEVKLLYVSIVHLYKHQWHVVKAVQLLRQKGFSVSLSLVGAKGDFEAVSLLEEAIKSCDPNGLFIKYLGQVGHDRLPAIYKEADIFVFASSCENNSNVLLEAMASGLPIACSDRSVMPEILQDGGVYFDPEDPNTIAAAIEKLMIDSNLRRENIIRAKALVSNLSWEKCASETFSFLQEVVMKKV